MAVYSMTGYSSGQGAARSSAETDVGDGASKRLIGLEFRSVNSRFLDLSLKLPEEWRQHEPALRAMASAKLHRGKVEIRGIAEDSDTVGPAQPSALSLARLDGIQNAVQAWLPDARGLSVADVLRLTATSRAPLTDCGPALLALAEQTLNQLLEARAGEGQRLAKALVDRLQHLRVLVEQAAPLIPELVAQQRSRFLQRWNDAIGSASEAGAEAAQDRALAEATAFALRIDVAEELTRLSAHLDEIARLLEAGGPIGKRLDFLIQELQREANTLGSKSAALDLSRIAIDMKVLVEQMREQVQNIE